MGAYHGMLPGLKVRAGEDVVMEAVPLLKHASGVRLILLVLPAQHARRVVEADLPTEGRDDRLRVVEQVVRVDHRDTDVVAQDAIRLADPSPSGSNDPRPPEEIKKPPQLVVAGLTRQEVVESCHLVQRRDCASKVRRDGATGMSDEEGEVEAPQDIGREHSRIGWRLWALYAVHTVDMRTQLARAFGISIAQRGSDLGWFCIRGEQVVGNVFDEDPLVLWRVSMWCIQGILIRV